MDVLKNKRKKEYANISRYSSFPIYYHTVDDKWVTGTTTYLNNTTPYQLHRVKEREDYDVLALYYYHNPVLYWVICSFNRIQDPFEPPKVGTVLKIPTLSSISYLE